MLLDSLLKCIDMALNKHVPFDALHSSASGSESFVALQKVEAFVECTLAVTNDLVQRSSIISAPSIAVERQVLQPVVCVVDNAPQVQEALME